MENKYEYIRYCLVTKCTVIDKQGGRELEKAIMNPILKGLEFDMRHNPSRHPTPLPARLRNGIFPLGIAAPLSPPHSIPSPLPQV